MARRGSSFFALACGGLLCTGGQRRRNGSALWSLEPIDRPAPPAVPEAAWPRNEIDHFVLAKLETLGRQPAPPLERQRLIRRAYFDLIGLPPTPEEVQAFVADIAPDAYEKVVDRLLASPRYGERWGRHWLDVVRYAETQRLRTATSTARRLAVSRLRHRRLQRRQALRPLRPRADRRRRDRPPASTKRDHRHRLPACGSADDSHAERRTNPLRRTRRPGDHHRPTPSSG